MQQEVTKIANGGAGIVRLPDGCICFADGALPGEIVEIRVVNRKKDCAWAVLDKVIEPHPLRRNPPCPYYGKCGGCNAQHATFPLQIEMLKQIAEDLFLRVAKIKLPLNWTLHFGTEWGYRHRAQVFRSGDGWGFQVRKTNTVVPIEKCLVLSENLNLSLQNFESVSVGENVKRYLFDNQSLHFLGRHINADESVFFQSNMPLLPTLINEVQKAAGEGERLLDLFCGIGLFSAFLQDKFKKIIGVEQNSLCRKFAIKNVSCDFSFHSDSAEVWCRQNEISSDDCVIIDPPRSGLPPDLCDFFCRNAVRKLIYVSCDPATLARDTSKLLSAGYELADIQGFAFYPQTFHLEMLAVFSRDG
ncbi:putative RNA methyltransferase [Fibrobacterales bacterium]|nr:putative RNA methyltransferase [Fibrobacterales bacterium]